MRPAKHQRAIVNKCLKTDDLNFTHVCCRLFNIKLRSCRQDHCGNAIFQLSWFCEGAWAVFDLCRNDDSDLSTLHGLWASCPFRFHLGEAASMVRWSKINRPASGGSRQNRRTRQTVVVGALRVGSERSDEIGRLCRSPRMTKKLTWKSCPRVTSISKTPASRAGLDQDSESVRLTRAWRKQQNLSHHLRKQQAVISQHFPGKTARTCCQSNLFYSCEGIKEHCYFRPQGHNPAKAFSETGSATKQAGVEPVRIRRWGDCRTRHMTARRW